MDILKDFTNQTIKLKPDYEGEVVATLVSSKFNLGTRTSVLYLHGYVDYFFQAHVAEKFNAQGFDFYALDLRKYGRSLLPHQHPNYCRDISEYFEEITIAIRQIHESGSGKLFLMGHSTGGLIASNYMNFGQEKNLIKGLILNSPFFDFYQNNLQKTLVYLAAKVIASIFPYAKVNGALPTAYAKSLHKDFHGEWDYNLDWKPITGFPTYFAWLLAIRSAHQKLANSNIKVPVLVMYSSASSNLSKFSEEAMVKDIVLDVTDIKRIGAKLGAQVTLLEIENAQHDIFLSSKNVREKAFNEMFAWLNKLESKMD
ncbi:alpha/beta hydrolase [Flavobacterium degerlachei]|jgi:alpha-beta hydrolase superfamily lysophospholipase|uniref:Lysophospholipase, alpha-beta hydrolase superfamily n=1 Tax=Flavobacterium degerlachei TaxID=229203 RepID=A0A1H2SN53_9FLAO|nr:alpha/beta hydrolase [Flavobacterium degerlachei]SDW33066.1 Lysophospholipase, alpha-beta hydrolase superfamily [Flavobacterium degerlachei]